MSFRMVTIQNFPTTSGFRGVKMHNDNQMWLSIGMLAVTSLYFLATLAYTFIASRMSSLMRREHDLRTNAILGYSPAEITGEGWTHLEIFQTIYNIGIGFAIVNEIVFEFQLGSDIDTRGSVSCDNQLPLFIPPAGSAEISFRMSSSQMAHLSGMNDRFERTTDLLAGTIQYRYHGINGSVCILKTTPRPSLQEMV